MSEESKTNTREVEIIKKDTVVKLELPLDFFFRLNQLILEFPVESEKMGKMLELIAANKDETDAMAYHLRTLLSLQLFIEEAARQQGHTEMITVDLDTGERVNKD
jgi:hypothetical protein